MELTTLEFSDFVKLADVIWEKGKDSVENHMRESGLVKELSISKNTGNSREFSEVETNEYMSYKGEGDQASRGRIQQGYTQTMSFHRIAENIGITWEMRNLNKYQDVVNRLTSAGEKGPKSIDLDLSHRISFGTSTSYTDRDGRSRDVAVGDGKALFATDHTLAGSNNTFSNRLSGNAALSKSSLEGMEKLAVEQTYNHLGEKMSESFDILWTTDDPNTVNTAREYLQSTAKPTDASHGGVTNVYNAKYKHVVLPRIATTAAGEPDTAKNKYWGIASSKNSSFYLGVWEEPHLIPPKANSNAEDVQTDDWEFRNRAGYGITVVGASWIKFSSGDGA